MDTSETTLGNTELASERRLDTTDVNPGSTVFGSEAKSETKLDSSDVNSDTMLEGNDVNPTLAGVIVVSPGIVMSGSEVTPWLGKATDTVAPASTGPAETSTHTTRPSPFTVHEDDTLEGEERIPVRTGVIVGILMAIEVMPVVGRERPAVPSESKPPGSVASPMSELRTLEGRMAVI